MSLNVVRKLKNGSAQSGKWWGPTDRRAIICIHGWQDNANSFDKLIPLLPVKYSYLAIDLPGHGQSSHLQKGLAYVNFEGLSAIRRIQKHYKWEKMSFLSHSMGSILSFMYSSLYANEVDFYIGIDAIKPPSIDVAKKHEAGGKILDKQIYYDSLSIEKSPAYTEVDLIKRWCNDTGNSLTEETCKILLKRATMKTADGLYKLIRDPRLKGDAFFGYTHAENLTFAEEVNCNVLILKAKGSGYFEKKENVEEVLGVLKIGAKSYEFHIVPGTHHLHLTSPEAIVPFITSFLSKIDNQEKS